METVAFFGAGMLGSGFIRSLRRNGSIVRIWNRTLEKAKTLETDGIQAFADPAEAARGASIVHLCVRDDAAVDAILEDALPGVDRETPIVDHTTVSPRGVVERSARLRELGYQFLHAPVFMGPPQALEATGIMLASGPKGTFDRVEPALAKMTGQVKYFGERVETAAVYKLLGNAMILTVVGGLNDVYRIAEAQGMSRADAYELFSFYNVGGQITGRGKRMAEEAYDPAWTLEMAHKDASLMRDAANGAPLPVIDAVEHLLRECIQHGLGNKDLAAIATRTASS